MSFSPSAGVHFCIVQPLGYVHSMGLLDAAFYFRHCFEQLGAPVTIAKNRLRRDVPNLVFGAHLGFDPAIRQSFPCIFVNLEQLGEGGSCLPAAYLELLRGSPVIDYDAANCRAYTDRAEEVPLICFGYAPYLRSVTPPDLNKRPIDLLFFGSMNERRKQLIERIEKTGRCVTVFDGPVYGPERDAFIVQSRAVLNCHFYESARFEQVRAFHVLSLGTPLVSELTERTQPADAYRISVNWFTNENLESFFADQYPAPSFAARCAEQLEAFRSFDPLNDYARALDFIQRAGHNAISRASPQPPDAPRRVLLGCGIHYQPGWLNIDRTDSAQPDIRLDLYRPLKLPVTLASPYWGTVELRTGGSDLIFSSDIPETGSELSTLMSNCLALLRVGGTIVIQLAREVTTESWQSAVRVHALQEKFWHRFTDEFWSLGWFEHRFALREFHWVDARLAHCAPEQATSLRIVLEKVPTTVADRMKARTMRPDFGEWIKPVAAAQDTLARRDAAFAPTLDVAPRSGLSGETQGRIQTIDPTVEVICVAYKRYGPLKVLVQCWLNQTAPNWRLRVYHDGPDAQFERIMAEFAALDPQRISYLQTPARHNDYGHSLRDIGLKNATGDYVLLTNDDNYYVPRFLEFVNEAIRQTHAEIILYDMVHSHDRPGLRPLPAYSFFPTQYSRGNLDMGAAIVRADLARAAGFRDRSHDGDATYFEDVVRMGNAVNICKIPRVLFVHN